MKKKLNEDNQIHHFISSSGSGTVINYGSGSGSCSTTLHFFIDFYFSLDISKKQNVDWNRTYRLPKLQNYLLGTDLPNQIRINLILVNDNCNNGDLFFF